MVMKMNRVVQATIRGLSSTGRQVYMQFRVWVVSIVMEFLRPEVVRIS
jgi:hypothetical protein